MLLDLEDNEIETILTSFDYSKQRIRDAQDTPYDLRQENLRRIDAVAEKLRGARRRKV